MAPLCCAQQTGVHTIPSQPQPRTSLVSFLAFSETECFKYCSCCLNASNHFRLHAAGTPVCSLGLVLGNSIKQTRTHRRGL
jgi:hypothetical protein